MGVEVGEEVSQELLGEVEAVKDAVREDPGVEVFEGDARALMRDLVEGGVERFEPARDVQPHHLPGVQLPVEGVLVEADSPGEARVVRGSEVVGEDALEVFEGDLGTLVLVHQVEEPVDAHRGDFFRGDEEDALEENLEVVLADQLVVVEVDHAEGVFAGDARSVVPVLDLSDDVELPVEVVFGLVLEAVQHALLHDLEEVAEVDHADLSAVHVGEEALDGRLGEVDHCLDALRELLEADHAVFVVVELGEELSEGKVARGDGCAQGSEDQVDLGVLEGSHGVEAVEIVGLEDLVAVVFAGDVHDGVGQTERGVFDKTVLREEGFEVLAVNDAVSVDVDLLDVVVESLGPDTGGFEDVLEQEVSEAVERDDESLQLELLFGELVAAFACEVREELERRESVSGDVVEDLQLDVFESEEGVLVERVCFFERVGDDLAV